MVLYPKTQHHWLEAMFLPMSNIQRESQAPPYGHESVMVGLRLLEGLSYE